MTQKLGTRRIRLSSSLSGARGDILTGVLALVDCWVLEANTYRAHVLTSVLGTSESFMHRPASVRYVPIAVLSVRYLNVRSRELFLN